MPAAAPPAGDDTGELSASSVPAIGQVAGSSKTRPCDPGKHGWKSTPGNKPGGPGPAAAAAAAAAPAASPAASTAAAAAAPTSAAPSDFLAELRSCGIFLVEHIEG